MGVSTISLGLGLGGGKAATSSGRLAGGGGAFPNLLSGSFDGTNDMLDVALETTMFSGDFTLSFWCRPDASTDSFHTLMQLGEYGGGFRLYRYPNTSGAGSAGKLKWWKGEGGFTDIFGEFGNTSANTWFNMTIIRSGTVMTAYQDGTEVDTADTAHTGQAYSSKVWDISFTTYPFDGLMDEVAIWDEALSEANITALYDSKGDARALSPEYYWRMGDGTGDTNSSGSSPASGDTVGTVVNQGTANTGSGEGNAANSTAANRPLYNDTVPS